MKAEPMSYLPMRDFGIIRIVCSHQGCTAVTELRVSRVEQVMKDTGGCCPVCRKPFTKPDVEGGADVVSQLAKIIMALDQLAPQVRIELPLPVQ